MDAQKTLSSQNKFEQKTNLKPLHFLLSRYITKHVIKIYCTFLDIEYMIYYKIPKYYFSNPNNMILALKQIYRPIERE